MVDDRTKNFAMYLANTYSNRKNMWAYCYRRGLGINTNMHLEAMHKYVELFYWTKFNMWKLCGSFRKLKYFFYGGKQVKRLDQAISGLMRMLVDYEFNRLVAIEKGTRSSFMVKNYTRHRQAINEDLSSTKSNGNLWSFARIESGDLYSVEKLDVSDLCC